MVETVSLFTDTPRAVADNDIAPTEAVSRNATPPPSGPLHGRSPVVRWGVLLGLTAVLVLLLRVLRLPASLLLGPMAAAILVVAGGGSLQVPRWIFIGAQGLVGCMIARSVTASIVGTLFHGWPCFLVTVGAVIAASTLLGWLMTRWRVLPGTTAVWGSSPGAATAMVLMADAYGADVRLVAFMQYLRVVLVVLVASVVSRMWMTSSATPVAAITWFPAIAWPSFIATLALAWLGAAVALQCKIPAGPLLLPLALGATLHGFGAMTIELPPWLLAASYAVIGWSIGLQFTRAILVYAAKVLPQVVLSILALIAICGGLAGLLVWLAGIDLLTAYLATSPGGADSVAIIATSTKVNVPFVMAMQTARFLVVVLAGPGIARFVAGRMDAAGLVPKEKEKFTPPL